MKDLKNIFEAMKSPEVGPREPKLGLTMTAGLAIIPRREQPLTEAQLMVIVSAVLQQPLAITCEERKIYGRKKLQDDFGEYYAENEVTCTEIAIDCVVDFKPNLDLRMLKAALTVSPREACLKHLTHLTLHKKFGSSDRDRAVLLNDYVQALNIFPEFVLYQICRHYWESDRRPFVPFIDEMKQACTIFKQALEDHLKRIDGMASPKISAFQPNITQEHKETRIERAQRMLALAKQNPTLLDVEHWQSEVDRLTQVAA